MRKTLFMAALALLGAGSCAFANIATFEGLTFTGASDHENGANLAGNTTITNAPSGGYGPASTEDKISSFSSGGVKLGNTHTHAYSEHDAGGDFLFDSWSGWAYSKATDTLTPGFENQYSAIAGGGADGSTNYAVGYQPVGEWAILFDVEEDFSGRGFYATNTTYGAFDMQTGSGFSKIFGGASGNDADWFMLTIQGWNGAASTGSVDFYLADFRFAENSQDYILDSWAFVDLSGLGTLDKLTFGMTSSDTGDWGMNTPATFAMDNVGAVPEPSTWILCGLGLAVACGLRLRRTPRKL